MRSEAGPASMIERYAGEPEESLRMSLLSRLAGLCLLSVTLLWASPGSATLVEALDLQTLVHEAEQVVLARVIGQQSRWDERGRIVTDVTLQVEETIKGDQA